MSGVGKWPGAVEDLVRFLNIARTAPGAPLSSTGSLPGSKEFTFFDWDLEQLPLTHGIVAIPKPGVVMAFHGEAATREAAMFCAFHLRRELERHPEIRAFLASPEAQFEPMRYAPVDVFISYSSSDAALASELRAQLEAADLSTFMAEKSLQIGSRWEPSIRSALRNSKVLALLMTPNSVSSPWVLFEAGAAWALEIPIAVAASYVALGQLPAALPAYQGRPFETQEQRRTFVADVTALTLAQGT